MAQVQSRICELSKIYCPARSCFEACIWLRFKHRKRVIEEDLAHCPSHGIVGVLLRGQLVLLFDFTPARRLVTPADSKLQLKQCIRCLKKPSHGRCTFRLCKRCCAGLRLACRVAEHKDHGIARYPGTPTIVVDPVPLRAISTTHAVKVEITCRHFWPTSPVRLARHKDYTAYCIVPRDQRRVYYDDLGSALLKQLRIDGVAVDRLLDAHDLEADPVFSDGFTRYARVDNVQRIALFVYVELEELARHVSLEPEERDLSRDWDTLGTVWALVRIYAEGFDWSEEHEMPLPRRRLRIEDCTFYLTDFSQQQREMLGIDTIPDTRINAGPKEPLAWEAWMPGVRVNEVEIWLTIHE